MASAAPRQRSNVRPLNIAHRDDRDQNLLLRVPDAPHASRYNNRPKRKIPRILAVVAALFGCLIAGIWLVSIYYLPPVTTIAAVKDYSSASGINKRLNHDSRVEPRRDVVGPHRQTARTESTHQSNNVLTIYMESPSTLDMNTKPLPIRKTSAEQLKKVEYPKIVADCSSSMPVHLPINDFPTFDPFLPWIHDYFIVTDDDHSHNKEVVFIAQNKRRCETGEGKEIVMKYWEPQTALLQSVPVQEISIEGKIRYKLSSPEEATVKETRFICHFHKNSGQQASTTLSKFPFNYEYVLWRKGRLPMYKEQGVDNSKFELSQLLFSCPIPEQLRDVDMGTFKLDIVPIRTPPRQNKQLFTVEHIGPKEFLKHADADLFNTTEEFGRDHILPRIADSGRWANLPLCPPPPSSSATRKHQSEVATTRAQKRPYHVTACTWTSASYMRRGDATVISDSTVRLKEWIVFHKLVGMDHLYVYDNTQLQDDGNETTTTTSPLREIAELFPDFVTYHSWPATVCSNNRPNFKNPGERSSQYAADAACRSKYGALTEWMAFIDTDEYLVPMRNNETWHGLLRDMEKANIDVLKMRSSRGRPRLALMEVIDDPTVCKSRNRRKSKFPLEPCVFPRQNETLLRVYNCDYIRHPRPDRFARAMKQIYRPANVLSHFVHYSTVTSDIARYYKDVEDPNKNWNKWVEDRDYHDKFLDELTEGTLIHAKTVLPYETRSRSSCCQNASKHSCAVGHECPDSTEFIDAIHQKNLFHDENGKYCNCWVDQHVETFWIPQLEKAMAEYS